MDDGDFHAGLEFNFEETKGPKIQGFKATSEQRRLDSGIPRRRPTHDAELQRLVAHLLERSQLNVVPNTLKGITEFSVCRFDFQTAEYV